VLLSGLELLPPAQALPRALACWQRTPWPIIAELVERLAAQVPSAPLPREPFHSEWMKRAATQDPLELDGLLGTLMRSWTFAKLSARVTALDAWPEDPRIAPQLLEILGKAAWNYTDHIRLQPLFVSLIGRSSDERVLERLRELQARPVARMGGLRTALGQVLPRLITRLEAHLRQRRPLEPGDEEIARRIVERLRPAPRTGHASREQLLQRIRENPDDDDARAVWVDLLLEEGDPRGELVSLERKPDPTEKETARMGGLVRKHGREWMGDNLAAILVNTIFQDGLLHAAGLTSSAGAAESVWAAATRDPHLATLHRLSKNRANEDLYAQLVFSHEARGLRAIDVPSRAFLAQAIASGRPFSHLALPKPPSAALMALLAQVKTLRVLSFPGRWPEMQQAVSRLAASPLRHQLHRVFYRSLDDRLDEAPAWLALMAPLPLLDVRGHVVAKGYFQRVTGM
jgi:uncharacterized protein (TIGR02996 family)